MERTAEERAGRRKVGMVLFGLAVGLPGMVVFTDKTDSPGLVGMCGIVAVLGGGVAAAAGAERRLLAIVPGLLAGAGAFAALLAYASVRDSIRMFELVIPLGLGSLPGVGLYWLLDSATAASGETRGEDATGG